MRPRVLVEGFEYDLHLLLEELPVGVLVEQGRAETLHFAGMVPAAHSEYHPAAGQDIRGGKILGQPEGMPHGRDIEAATELEVLGEVGEVDVHHQEIGQALVAFRLEVVFGHPHRVVAVPVHGGGDGLSLFENRGEMIIAETAVVHRRAAVPEVVHIHVAGI